MIGNELLRFDLKLTLEWQPLLGIVEPGSAHVDDGIAVADGAADVGGSDRMTKELEEAQVADEDGKHLPLQLDIEDTAAIVRRMLIVL
jgi:hypothetical protein